MTDRLICLARALAMSIAVAATVASCGSPAQPTRPPTDPPVLQCPAPVSASSVDGNPVPITYTDPVVSGGQAPFTLACTPVSGANFTVGTTSVGCTVTDAVKRAASCTIAVTVAVPPKPMLTVTRFVAFGDSITWGEDGRNFASTQSVPRSRPQVQFPLFQTYPGVLQSLLAARYTTQSPLVDPQGLKGEWVTGSTVDPTEPGYLRFRRTIASGNYDVALIMEGSNDLSNRDDRIEPSVIADLQTMILDAKSRGMIVFLATIPPMNPAGSRGLPWSLVPGFDDKVRALASDQQVPLVDVYAALSGDVNTYIGFDGLHPTAEGYAAIANTFFQRIKQTLEAQASPSGTRVTAGPRAATPPARARPSGVRPRQ